MGLAFASFLARNVALNEWVQPFTLHYLLWLDQKRHYLEPSYLLWLLRSSDPSSPFFPLSISRQVSAWQPSQVVLSTWEPGPGSLESSQAPHEDGNDSDYDVRLF